MTMTLLFVVFAVCPAAEREPPRQILEGDGIRLTIDLPDAKAGYYRGTRFDWSGIVSKAEIGGHTVFGYWKTTHHPNHHDDVGGPAEEFGHDVPLGYADAPVGGTFVKIGIGELTKSKDAKYSFAHNYSIAKPGDWKVTSDKGSITFEQDLAHSSGYGYRYVKRIEMVKGGFAIRRELTNTGTRPIDTDHYGHHFMTVDGDPIGPNYSLRFPFTPTATESKDFRDIAVIRGDRVVFLKPLDRGWIQSRITGFGKDAKDNTVTVEHSPSGISLEIVNDQPLAKFNLWSVKTTLCPEPFVHLAIGVGETAKWQTRYLLTIRR